MLFHQKKHNNEQDRKLFMFGNSKKSQLYLSNFGYL